LPEEKGNPVFLSGFRKVWKVGMASRQQSAKYTEGRPSRFGFLLSLVAFLLYFLLPLTYFVHLTTISLPAASGDLKIMSPIIASETEEPVSPHDSNACPICRGASSFEDYGTSLAFHAPDSSSLVGLLSDGYGSSGVAKADVVTSHTRAPPVVPLAQSTA
jgi:hypothetical protein